MSRVPLSQRRNAQAGLVNGLRRMARGSATGQFAQASPARPPVKANRLGVTLGDLPELILVDSSGGRWRVTVDTTGHLTTTAL